MPDLGRTMVIKRRTTFKIGVAIGAALMYLLDPQNGQQRRRRLRDRLVAAPRALADLVAEVKGELDDAGEVIGEVADDIGQRLPDRQQGHGGDGAWSSNDAETVGRT